MEKLSEAERTIVIFAINTYGTFGHPMASDGTLKHFKPSYVKMCLTKMADAGCDARYLLEKI